MTRKRVSFTYELDRTLEMLSHGGLLLASTARDGRSNAMTIGWATVGVIWGLPIMVVLVRPSRYTYAFIEESGLFTVNVPTPAMRSFVSVCGTKSGRDVDKLAGIVTEMGQEVSAVIIDECPVVYECQVVHWNDVVPGNLLPDVSLRSYPEGDFHRMYYGQIRGVFAK